MNDIIVNKYFKDNYLTCGRTYDNYIFENCPISFILFAYDSLKTSSDDVFSCCIKIDRSLEEKFEGILNCVGSDYRKKIVARDFFVSLFIYELIKDYDVNLDNIISFEELEKGIKAFFDGNVNEVMEFCKIAPLTYDIKRIIDKRGKIELNIFLINTQNIELQKAINLFVSSRELYSIKIFSNKEKLPSYVDQQGVFIENPHDYMRVDVNKFIEMRSNKK